MRKIGRKKEILIILINIVILVIVIDLIKMKENSNEEYYKTSIEKNFKDIVYVNENGKDELGYGLRAKPYKTINYALKNVKNNGSIYIDGKITLKSIVIFSKYNKDINIIGDYKESKSEIYIENKESPYGMIRTNNNKVTINGLKILNERIYYWGETFAYCNDLTLNNCVFQDNSGYSNVYGNYTFNNCVIEKIGQIYSPTKFNNCVFLGSAQGNNSIGGATIDKDYNITSQHSWINVGVDKNGNKTNIGVYGGMYAWE